MSASLDKAVATAGYYPALASHVLKIAIGSERVKNHFVQAETTFFGREVRRHMTVLVLTPTRFIRVHIDDGQEGEASNSASATIESALLRTVSSVALTHIVRDPEQFREGDIPSEVVLAVGWGVHSRIELEPAVCPDENCDADHGYTGGITGDDTMVRVSAIADGEASVRALEGFAAALNAAVGEHA
ncbi:MAG: phosphodiesterase [Demequinaceae bacterium]|nr:phosphodiesterase [Demequinaceae bacterium]